MCPVTMPLSSTHTMTGSSTGSADRARSPLDLLPQHVPSRACATCEVCCRFPEADSLLRPYFSAEELAGAIRRGYDASLFPDHSGSQIRLVPHPTADGFMCPAFDPATTLCGLYDERPFDCQLYPMALMWDVRHEEIVLGWDPLCPFLQDDAALAAYAERVAVQLEAEPRLSMLAANPRVVTPFQPAVVVRHRLPTLTARLCSGKEARAGRAISLADRRAFEAAAAGSALAEPEYPSAWAFAAHYLWMDLLPQQIRTMHDRVYVFADCPDGRFMPVPPLGGDLSRASVDAAFAAMKRQRASGADQEAFASPTSGSGAQGVARIESVPASWAAQCAAWGYRVVPKDPEYLYDSAALAELKGDRFKSQRAACNRLLREHVVAVEPYDGQQDADCWALYQLWRGQKQAAGGEEWGALLLEDSASFHRRLLRDALALGLKGLVLRAEGRVCGYTFGVACAQEVFCVLAEITDRSIVGAAESLSRALARHAQQGGYRLLNAMDATGLPGLARTKVAYHPVATVPLYTVYEA